MTSGRLQLGVFVIFDLLIWGTVTLGQPIETVVDGAINGFTGGLGRLVLAALLGKFGED